MKGNGFSLIELLVIIAIIGILAGIVLTSLGGARDSAKDARIQAAMQQVRSVASLVYNEDSAFAYDDLCEGPVNPNPNTLNENHTAHGAQIGVLETEVDVQNGGAGGVPACFGSGDDYCVSAVLTNGTSYFCVSAIGNAGDDECLAATTTCN